MMFREMYANIWRIYRSARVHYKVMENPVMEKIEIKAALGDSLTFPRNVT